MTIIITTATTSNTTTTTTTTITTTTEVNIFILMKKVLNIYMANTIQRTGTQDIFAENTFRRKRCEASFYKKLRYVHTKTVVYSAAKSQTMAEHMR
jgi:hypothetical protein